MSTIPAGVAAIDTSARQVVGRTDEPISDIFISRPGPACRVRVHHRGIDSVYVSESTGLYMLDPTDLSTHPLSI